VTILRTTTINLKAITGNYV